MQVIKILCISYLILLTTARDLDYRIITTQIRISPSAPLSDVHFTLINDSIGQEEEETFCLQLERVPLSAITGDIAYFTTLDATIIDSDGEFSW